MYRTSFDIPQLQLRPFIQKPGEPEFTVPRSLADGCFSSHKTKVNAPHRRRLHHSDDRPIAILTMTPPKKKKKSESVELEKKNLNVSAGLEIYERAASRRDRHRAILREAAQDTEVVALGRRQSQRPQQQQPRREVFQEDGEREQRYEDMGRLRLSGVDYHQSLPRQVASAQAVQKKAAKLKAERLLASGRRRIASSGTEPAAAAGAALAAQKKRPTPQASSTSRRRLLDKFDHKNKRRKSMV